VEDSKKPQSKTISVLSINHKITISEKNSQVVKKGKVRIKIQKQNKKRKSKNTKASARARARTRNYNFECDWLF